MEPVRLGVIGCGVIGPSHLKLAAECEAAEVVAVADLVVVGRVRRPDGRVASRSLSWRLWS